MSPAKRCLVVGCRSAHKARGLCKKHYNDGVTLELVMRNQLTTDGTVYREAMKLWDSVVVKR